MTDIPEGIAIAGPDAGLLACAADFWRELEAAESAHRSYVERRQAVLALPGCPRQPTPRRDPEGARRFKALLAEHGTQAMEERYILARAWVVDAGSDVFVAPAETAAGVLAKLEIARRLEIDENEFEGIACGVQGDILEQIGTGEETLLDKALGDLRRLSSAVVPPAPAPAVPPATSAEHGEGAPEPSLAEMHARVIAAVRPMYPPVEAPAALHWSADHRTALAAAAAPIVGRLSLVVALALHGQRDSVYLAGRFADGSLEDVALDAIEFHCEAILRGQRASGREDIEARLDFLLRQCDKADCDHLGDLVRQVRRDLGSGAAG